MNGGGMTEAMNNASAQNSAVRPAAGIVSASQNMRVLRIVWWTVTLVLAGSFAIAAFARYDELRQPCEAAEQNRDCGYYVLTPTQVEALNDLGLSLDFYATYQIIVDGLPVLAFLGLGIFIVWQRPGDRVAQGMSLGMVAIGLAILPEIPTALERAYPAFGAIWLALIYALAMPAFVYVNATFPNGRFEPRWMLWAALGMVTAMFGSIILELFTSYSTADVLVVGLVAAGLLLWIALMAGQVQRFRRLFSRAERQQVKWVLLGLLSIVAGGTTWALVFDQQVIGGETTRLWFYLVLQPLLILFGSILPVSMAFAILRYRLYDIDIILNRTLVYAVLTGLVVATYVLIVGGLGALIQGRSDSWLPFVAVGVVAILLQPVRDRVQRGANRLMFGERDEPYALLAQLGHNLSATSPPDAALQRTVETVGSALKLPYAAIDLHEGDDFVDGAVFGEAVAEPLVIPMFHQRENVGRLLISPRSPSERFTDKERQLLDDIAVQAGAVASSVRLTRTLQQARERLVFAREEERRRIRRDLHDGLGPTLATQTLSLDAAIDLLPDDPEAAQRALQSIKRQNAALIGDIRRLVYELRPPALDELHLVGAIRSYAAQMAGRQDLRISVEAQPEPLPDVPAAVEVAVFRVVEEALTNVIRHARASECRVGLEVVVNSPISLNLEIVDDGVGVPANPNSGIGLRSMRDRVEELGGRFEIVRLSNGGTRISASIPLGDTGGQDERSER